MYEVVRNSLIGLVDHLINGSTQSRKLRYVWPFLVYYGCPSFRVTSVCVRVCVCTLIAPAFACLIHRKWSHSFLKGQDSCAFCSHYIGLVNLQTYVYLGMRQGRLCMIQKKTKVVIHFMWMASMKPPTLNYDSYKMCYMGPVLSC